MQHVHYDREHAMTPIKSEILKFVPSISVKGTTLWSLLLQTAKSMYLDQISDDLAFRFNLEILGYQ